MSRWGDDHPYGGVVRENRRLKKMLDADQQGVKDLAERERLETRPSG